MSTTVWARKSQLGLLAVAATLGVGCDGCGNKTPEQGSPLQFVPADADAVIELRDISMLGAAREGVLKSFGALVPEEQVKSLQQEFDRAFGFDPTSKAGLAKAGLSETGAVAGHLLADGKGAVWIAPVRDEKKLAPLLLKIIKGRVSVDKTSTTKVGTSEVTVYSAQFGADDVTVAAHTFAKGFVLVGAGRKAVDLLKAALAVSPDKAVDKSPEYLALTKGLDPKWDLRMISPKGGEALKGALRTAARSVPEARALLGANLDVVASAGWSANFSAKGVEVKGDLRLTEAGKVLAHKVFAAPGAPGKGVLSVAIPEAVVFAQLALQPQAVIDLLAPEGSPARRRFEAAKSSAKRDANLDFEAEILPLLTGHVALALGVGGLDKVSFQQLMGNPRSVVWTAAGIGVKEPAAAVALEKRLDPGLKQRGFDIVTRQVKGKSIRGVVPPKDPTEPEAPAPMVETTGYDGAWVFANEGALMNRVAANDAGASGLGGKGGLFVEVNFRELNTQISSFRFGDLPVLYRSLLAKVLDAVKLLSKAKLHVSPSPDGVTMSGSLELVPLAKP